MENNQSSLQKSIIILLVIAVIVIGGVYFYKRSTSTTDTGTPGNATSTSSTSTPDGSTPGTGGMGTGYVLPANYSTYTSSEYGFKMGFPIYAKMENSFTSFNNLGNGWRINPAPVNQGKAVVAFPIFRVDQGSVATGKNYPLFYTAEVRVGVSNNVKECYSNDGGVATPMSDITINGTVFKRFSFGDAGMQKYLQGVSYRTVHNNMCYVLEQVKAGSSYRDETMKPGLSEEVLQGYYAVGEAIVKTFAFTK